MNLLPLCPCSLVNIKHHFDMWAFCEMNLGVITLNQNFKSPTEAYRETLEILCHHIINLYFFKR